MEQEAKHPLLVPALATASKPTQQVTSLGLFPRQRANLPALPEAQDPASDSAHRCLAQPHLSPGLLPPGCAALQVAGLGGGGLPWQACTLDLLHSLLAASPVGPDAVDGAGLGATSAGSGAGCPGPCLPAGTEQEPVRLAQQQGPEPRPEGVPALTHRSGLEAPPHPAHPLTILACAAGGQRALHKGQYLGPVAISHHCVLTPAPRSQATSLSAPLSSPASPCGLLTRSCHPSQTPVPQGLTLVGGISQRGCARPCGEGPCLALGTRTQRKGQLPPHTRSPTIRRGQLPPWQKGGASPAGACACTLPVPTGPCKEQALGRCR